MNVLAFDGCMGMEVLGICDALRLANRIATAIRGAAAEPLFDVRVTSVAGGAVLAESGVAIGTRKLHASQDLLVIPGMDIGDGDGCTRPQEKLATEVKTIARAVRRSPRLRRLKTETGQTPLEYLQGERVNTAKRLLESGTFSVAQITERVGYVDVATFSTLFKRLVGQSPAQYRRDFSVRAPPAV